MVYFYCQDFCALYLTIKIESFTAHFNKNSVDKIRELQEFIETNFESVNFEEFEKNPVEKGITPDYLLNLVNEALPNLFGSKQALGKVLREVVIDGDNVRYKDLSDKRYYNLRYLKDEKQ